jgi:hypothetical protein
MVSFKIFSRIFYLLTFCCFIGCQEKSTEPNPELMTLGLLRGEPVLCSGKELGDVMFLFACKAAAREDFGLAVSLLHSFEYDEAEKAFVKVIDADPGCAMAYWGVAMSNFHPLWAPPTKENLDKGAAILKLAEPLPKSEKEQEYLNAIGVVYKDFDKKNYKTRASEFEQRMSAIYEKYKDDKEAAIFYALALVATANPADKTYAHQRKAGKILEGIFPGQPNHPGIAHYIIHAYDYPGLAGLALPTARKYAQIAPSSAHAQHMPSHIFIRLGLWDEANSSNLNSTASAKCYAENVGITGHWDEELHGMDYLVYGYLQKGDNVKAMEQLQYLQTFQKVYPANFKIAYAVAAIPARIALENRQWEKAATLQLPSLAFPWEKHPWEKSIFHFAKAMGAVHTGKLDMARQELATLQANRQQLIDAQDTYSANQVDIQIKAVQAWLKLAEGNPEQAITLMQEAATLEDNTAKHPVTPGEVLPARELLGDLFLVLKKPAQALEAYESDLKTHPNRLNGLYGAARAAQETGDMEKAAGYYSGLLKSVGTTASDRPEIAEAKEFVAQNN